MQDVICECTRRKHDPWDDMVSSEGDGHAVPSFPEHVPEPSLKRSMCECTRRKECPRKVSSEGRAENVPLNPGFPLTPADVALEIQSLRRVVENMENMMCANRSFACSPADMHPQISELCLSLQRTQEDMQRSMSNSAQLHAQMKNLRSDLTQHHDLHLAQVQNIKNEVQSIKNEVQPLHAGFKIVASQMQYMESSEEALRKRAQMDMIQNAIEELVEKRDELANEHALVQKRDVLEEVSAQAAAIRAEVRKGPSKKGLMKIRSSPLLGDRGSTSCLSRSGKSSANLLPRSNSRTVSVFSTRSRATLESMPPRAFVINFRRLIWVTELLNLVHELIKSTAIAALTLLAAASRGQMLCSFVFIGLVFITYARHEMVHDSMDIQDVNSLVPLMDEDDFPGSKAGSEKLLRSVSLYSRQSLHFIGRTVYFVLIVVSIFGWLCQHAGSSALATPTGTSLDSLQSLSLALLNTDEDFSHMAMQLFILNVMIALEVIFEYILWRETAHVYAEDPRPSVAERPQSWCLGLPSLWFTSHDGLQELKSKVVEAQMRTNVDPNEMEIYPHELARYALQGDDERLDMSKTLEDLRITLVFYDNKRQTLQDVVDASELEHNIASRSTVSSD